MRAIVKERLPSSNPFVKLLSLSSPFRSFTTSTFVRDQQLDHKLLVEALRGQTASNGFPPMDYSRKQKEKKAAAVPRPSSSVLLVSPNNQVLLLQRVKQSSSFASAHVFPGGKIMKDTFSLRSVADVVAS